MLTVHQGLGAILYLITVPLLTVGTKLVYLVPLLIKWNNPHYSSSRRSPFQNKNGRLPLPLTYGMFKSDNYAVPVKRLGIHHVSISDPAIIQSVLDENVRCVEAVQGSVVARSNIVVRGCGIAAGTLITFDAFAGALEM
jgi:hypothetical protein